MLQFSDTTNYRGILQQIEDELGFDRATITGSTTKLKNFTALVNLTWDNYLHLAFQASGTWQYDDSNHTDYPTIETDLVANQRDITFTTDENGNLILDIFKVLVKDPSGNYFEVDPIDQQQRNSGASIWDGQNTTGTPSQYDKTANGIIFDVLPNYSWRIATEGERGVKILVNREASYFTTGDTTKKPGCPGLHHRYFVLRPALDFARQKNMEVEASLRNEVLLMERSIKEYFGKRSRDEAPIMKPKLTSFL